MPPAIATLTALPPASAVNKPGRNGTRPAAVWWEKDRDGRYLRASENFCAFFGIAHCPDPRGLQDRQLFDARFIDLYRAGDRQTLAAAHPVIQEEAYPGGWLETVRSPVFDAAGRAVGVFGLAREIGERRRPARAEDNRDNAYRSLVENSPDIILRFDRRGLLVYANATAFAFGKCRPADVYGRPADQHGVLPPAEAHRLTRQIGEIVATGSPREAEFDWSVDHEEFHLHLRLVPEFAEDGSVGAVLVFGRDLSSLHDTRNRLRKSHDLLRTLAIRRQLEQEEVRRDITHRIHEGLAQELSALRMHLKLLSRHFPEQPAPSLAAIDDITARCIARIRDMVTTLRPNILDQGIVPALRWLADDFHRGLELKFRLTLPESLALDDHAVTFLFRSAQEALLNIALHAAASHCAIELRHDCGKAVLRIHDNGVGFDPCTPPPVGAVGLLGIAEQARHLGGELMVSAAPGHGTCLEVSLPLGETSAGPA